MDEQEGTAPERIALPADLTAPGVARAHTRSVLRGWRRPELPDPLLLALRELVSNAVRHGRPPVDLLLRRAGRGVRLEVHDEAPGREREVSLSGPDAESGRGLFLVETVASDTGVEQVPGDGKTAWATFEPGPEPGRPG